MYCSLSKAFSDLLWTLNRGWLPYEIRLKKRRHLASQQFVQFWHFTLLYTIWVCLKWLLEVRPAHSYLFFFCHCLWKVAFIGVNSFCLTPFDGFSPVHVVKLNMFTGFKGIVHLNVTSAIYLSFKLLFWRTQKIFRKMLAWIDFNSIFSYYGSKSLPGFFNL